MLDFKRLRFPGEIIGTSVRRYLRYKLSIEDVVELLLEWVQKFGPLIAAVLDKKHREIGGRWF